MKKIVFIALCVSAIGFIACQNKIAENANVNNERVDSLHRIITQKDNEINDMMSTLNEIQEGIRQVSEAENRVTIVKDGESTNKASQIRENIQFISNQMKRNRELVSKLRQQLRESSIKGDKLKETLDGLVQQLDAKDRELQQLREELAQKDIHIQELNTQVSTLNTNVSTLTEESQKQTQTISTQDKQLHTAFYVFGTKSELKAQNILAGDRVLQANFNKNYFTKVDIRVDKEIKLYSKSAKLLTAHPASSYTLDKDANKQYVLRITNPDSFWSTSKYLVVLVK
ncbi:MAG: hypothetical protein ACTTIF_01440 [Prevotella sp.]